MAGKDGRGGEDDLRGTMTPDALRVLTLQHAELDRGRTRAVLLLGGSALSTAFTVGQVLPSGPLSLAALCMFIGIGVVTILALAVRVDVPIDLPASASGRAADRPPGEHGELDAVVANNRSNLDRQGLFTQIAVTLLVVQIALSSIDLAALR
jgi:hypothetical protein